MDKKKLLLLILSSLIAIGGIGTGLLVIREPVVIEKQAQVERGPICSLPGVCSWQAGDGGSEGVSYKVQIFDTTGGGFTPVSEFEQPKVITQTQVSFQVQANHTYKCVVVPVNECGEGPETQAENTCAGGQVTITPTSGPLPTPTLTPGEPSPTPTVPLLTLTPTLTITPTPGGPSETPTPTGAVGPTETPTPGPSPTPTPGPQDTPTPTSEPTEIAQAGPTEAPIPAPDTPAAGGVIPAIIGVLSGIGVILLALLL